MEMVMLIDCEHELPFKILSTDPLAIGEAVIGGNRELERFTKQGSDRQARIIDGQGGQNQIVLAACQSSLEIPRRIFADGQLESVVSPMKGRKDIGQ